MAVQVINQVQTRSIDKSAPFSLTMYLGLSTDVKPIDCEEGSTFEETDSGNIYKFNGSAWNLDAESSVVIKGKATDGEYYYVKSDNHGYSIPIDYIHALVHEKIVYTISHTFLAVAQNGFARLRIKTFSKAVHFEINYNSDLKCRLKTYASPTISTAGTIFEPFNRIIGYTGTKEFQVYLSPTFTGGTLRANDFIGSNTGVGGNATRAGGGANGGIESVLIPNQEYIIEFQNVGNAFSDIGVLINCYERPYTA